MIRAICLDPDMFQYFLNIFKFYKQSSNNFLWVDRFASICMHCVSLRFECHVFTRRWVTFFFKYRVFTRQFTMSCCFPFFNCKLYWAFWFVNYIEHPKLNEISLKLGSLSFKIKACGICRLFFIVYVVVIFLCILISIYWISWWVFYVLAGDMWLNWTIIW